MIRPRLAPLVLLALAGCGGADPGRVPDLADLAGLGDRADLAGASHDASVEAGADQAPPATDLGAPLVPFVYVGGYGPAITRFRLDAVTGQLVAAGTTMAGGNPSFLAVDPSRRHLYAVDEGGDRVAAFTIDPSTGALTALGAVSSGGSGPAHLFVDRSGGYVMVANYGDGAVAVLPVLGNGSLGASVDTRVAGRNAHQIVTDGSNRFAFVPCLGDDAIAQYSFDAVSGRLGPNTPPRVAVTAGSGPRHIAFRPDGKSAYAILETQSTMIAFSVDAAAGRLTEMQTLSTLPLGFAGMNTGAEVVVDPTGRFLYGSNRGDDSIVVYALDAAGRMTLVGHKKSGGLVPRSFTLAPSGRHLLVAHQGSDDVTVWSLDPQSGMPSAVAATVAVTAPAFVGVIEL